MNQEEILDKILALKSVKMDIAKYKEIYPNADEAIMLDLAITDFLGKDYDEISEGVPEIWAWLQAVLRQEFEDQTCDARTFAQDGIYFRPEEYADDKVDDLLGSLRVILKRRFQSKTA